MASSVSFPKTTPFSILYSLGGLILFTNSPLRCGVAKWLWVASNCSYSVLVVLTVFITFRWADQAPYSRVFSPILGWSSPGWHFQKPPKPPKWTIRILKRLLPTVGGLGGVKFWKIFYYVVLLRPLNGSHDFSQKFEVFLQSRLSHSAIPSKWSL